MALEMRELLDFGFILGILIGYGISVYFRYKSKRELHKVYDVILVLNKTNAPAIVFTPERKAALTNDFNYFKKTTQ